MEDRYLFKAKHIHVLPNNNRLDGSWVVGFLSGERYIANDSGEYLIDPSTICQCTGLKDKNGKLIGRMILFINHSIQIMTLMLIQKLILGVFSIKIAVGL